MVSDGCTNLVINLFICTNRYSQHTSLASTSTRSMTNRGRVADRGRGRAIVTAGGGVGGRGLGSESLNANRGRGGTPSSFRGGASDRGSGRGYIARGGLPNLRGRGRARYASISTFPFPAPDIQSFTLSIFMHGQRAEIDPRIADDSDKALVASFNSAGAATDVPLRPDFGTDGREIKLRTNFFPVQFHQQNPSLKLCAYHIDITPNPGLRRTNRRVYDLAERTSAWGQAGLVGTVVHDNNSRLFSASMLPQPLMIRVPYYTEDQIGPPRHGSRVYTLSIIFVQEIDTETFTRC